MTVKWLYPPIGSTWFLEMVKIQMICPMCKHKICKLKSRMSFPLNFLCRKLQTHIQLARELNSTLSPTFSMMTAKFNSQAKYFHKDTTSNFSWRNYTKWCYFFSYNICNYLVNNEIPNHKNVSEKCRNRKLEVNNAVFFLKT